MFVNIIYMTRNNRFRIIRLHYGYKQFYVAMKLKCDESLYSKYERNEREMPLRLMIKLSELYNVSTDYLLGLSDIPTRR